MSDLTDRLRVHALKVAREEGYGCCADIMREAADRIDALETAARAAIDLLSDHQPEQRPYACAFCGHSWPCGDEQAAAVLRAVLDG